jgi:hypothetical protein
MYGFKCPNSNATSNINLTNRQRLPEMTMKFPYIKCTTWLRERVAELKAQGFQVEAKENAAPEGVSL